MAKERDDMKKNGENYDAEDPSKGNIYSIFQNATDPQHLKKSHLVKKIDKLLLDYNLPDLSGIDILKRIEKNPKIRDVYMVTGFRLLKKMKTCDRFKKIYIKPFSLEYAKEIINHG